MQRNAHTARAAAERGGETGSVVVHVQLRPRRGSTRRCLAALAALAAGHDGVGVTVTGLSKDDRVVRVTVGVDLGPRAGVAKFSPQAQAAYAFVSELFTTLYDFMPVYTAEPGAAERAAAATLIERAAGGSSALDALDAVPTTPVVAASPVPASTVPSSAVAASAVPASRVPLPRAAGPGERIPA
ncbi:hypothetical protein OF117_08855 [Geodermatophilus sp. YIM 151500]|uniref:hypothetical protein n=1 Tax=Geodermatophilus sp. YIM 151500 TaxID=2984531 RepID=UPI0021E42F8E|nr:hypothetical protein [Geodermatophilus sp. YIM 151500]MCV2489477.1 hypothetical protein [Geodermatophilus sp. YIM 151500]